MPEYLAPGVYVEETSFRSKPIEGVSTSTTGFAGPTRKGPISGVPELITSFGEFERVFGGFGDLVFGTGTQGTINFMAHAVRAYFDNGGARLYVARAYSPVDETAGSGRARSENLIADPNEVRFFARFPGTVGNGQVRTSESTTQATWRTLDSAPEGSVALVDVDARPAATLGGLPPFRVANNSVLTLNGTGLTFEATQAERAGGAPPVLPLTLGGAGTFSITINGVDQVLDIRAGTYETVQALADEINRGIVGGRAVVAGGALVLRSDIRGRAGSVRVRQARADLGFAAADPNPIPGTGVNNLDAVAAGDIQALIAASPLGADVVASLDASSGRLRLATSAGGEAAALTVAAGNALTALGLVAGVSRGVNGAGVRAYEKVGESWVRINPANPAETLVRNPNEVAPAGGARIATLTVEFTDGDGRAHVFGGLGYGAAHPRSVQRVLAPNPSRAQDALEHLFSLRTAGVDVTTAAVRTALVGTEGERRVPLNGGNDGLEPSGEAFIEALGRLVDVEGISIVAAPGHSALTSAAVVRNALITHVEEHTNYRIAVLDTPPDLTVTGAQAWRADVDSKYAALYHPWLVVANPLARPGNASIPAEIAVPPSGHVCGIYARNDIERGVHKAPANEVVRGIVRFATSINHAQQEVLNPAGVNCFRSFPGRGLRLWGARLASSDGEWKYVSDRRYFNYLEASIDRGTQWAVFEPNGEALWANIRQSVSEFLYNEWRSGRLLGGSAEVAYFVRCDRSTMTQNDLDNGRLICEIGVAVLKPAEFVIFRIGQKTADAT